MADEEKTIKELTAEIEAQTAQLVSMQTALTEIQNDIKEQETDVQGSTETFNSRLASIEGRVDELDDAGDEEQGQQDIDPPFEPRVTALGKLRNMGINYRAYESDGTIVAPGGGDGDYRAPTIDWDRFHT